MIIEKTVEHTNSLDINIIYKMVFDRQNSIRKYSVSKQEMEDVRQALYDSIEQTGLNSAKTLQISKMLNYLISYEEDDTKKEKLHETA